MAGIVGCISRLEARRQAIAAEAEEDEKLERQRAIMRLVLDEHSAQGDRSFEEAVRSVVSEQYADLGEKSREYIADGWIETLREWTRLDWMVKAGRARPSSL